MPTKCPECGNIYDDGRADCTRDVCAENKIECEELEENSVEVKGPDEVERDLSVVKNE